MTSLSVVLLSLGSLVGQSRVPVMPPISVCDAFERRLSYNGRLAAIRGEIKAGPHGIFLLPLTECNLKIAARGINWPNRMYLEFPSTYPPDPGYKVDFQMNWAADAAIQKGIDRARPGERLAATVIGQFITYPNLDEHTNPPELGGSTVGFGPQPANCPAMLVIKAVEDIIVLPHEPHQKK